MPAIAAWGNSLAVRIPKEVLEQVGLRREDVVDIVVNDAGHIEIIPVEVKHRRGIPTPGVTFESLFEGYTGGPQKIRDDQGKPLDPWIDEGFYGAEWEVWSH